MLFLSIVSYAQDAIPSRLLKGVEVSTDEFTGTVLYSMKNCCLEIEQTNDSVTLYLNLSCSQFYTPLNVKTIYISTNGETTIIPRDGNFSLKENPVRVSVGISTVYETRMQYIETWRANAELYMGVINSIINNLGKVKFEGENNAKLLEFSKKDAQRMQAIMQLFDYLKQL